MKNKNKQFQQKPKKVLSGYNGFAAAYNEPTVNFPNSDTVGGVLTIEEGPNPPFFVNEPMDYNPIVKDPIIDEVSFVNPNSGGGIVKDIVPIRYIDSNMNPDAPVDEKPQVPETPTTTAPTKKKFPWALVVVAVLVIAGFIYLNKKKLLK